MRAPGAFRASVARGLFVLAGYAAHPRRPRLRLVALREGGRIEETLATGNERETLKDKPTHVNLAHASFRFWSSLFQPTPSTPCDLA